MVADTPAPFSRPPTTPRHAQALHRTSTKLPAVLAAVLAGAWLLQRVGLLGGILGLGGQGGRGAGGRRGRGVLFTDSEGDEEEEGGGGGGGEGGRGRGRSRGRGRLTNDERLLIAFDHADAVYKVGCLHTVGTTSRWSTYKPIPLCHSPCNLAVSGRGSARAHLSTSPDATVLVYSPPRDHSCVTSSPTQRLPSADRDI